MPREIVRKAIEDARGCDALVRTMALLAASRVLSAIDKAEAQRVFLDGVARAEGLSVTDRQRALVLDQAVRIGITVHPVAAVELFRRQPSADHAARHMTGRILAQTLAQNGDIERAVELLEDLTCDVGGAASVVYYADDPAMKLRAISAARERWRAKRANPERVGRHDTEFHEMISMHWRLLPPEDASRWLDEVLHAIDADPDRPVGAGFGQDVHLRSSRDVQLFYVLNMLRALRPARDVEALLARHPDVANAARTFPLGYESVITQPPPARRDESGPTEGFAYVGSGSAQEIDFIPTMMAAHRGERSAVRAMLDQAHRVFADDTDPADGNLAPLAFWPSCNAFRRALYWGGRIIGSSANGLIDEVPERELAVLASLELAAGLVGLGEFGWIQSSSRRRARS